MTVLQEQAHRQDGPPTRPQDWAAADAEARTYVVLSIHPPPPYADGQTCACGGTWRYTLGGSEVHPIWRCLHCGGLHRGERRFA